MKKIILGVVGCTLLAFGCSHNPSLSNGPLTESDRLNLIIADYTESAKHIDPFGAAYFHLDADLDKFGDFPSPAMHERKRQLIQKELAGIRMIRPEALEPKDRIAYALFKENMETSMRSFDFPGELLDFTQMSNRLHEYMDDTSQSLTSFPFNSVKHYDAFLKRSEGFPTYIDTQIALLQRGIREKVMQTCDIAAKVPSSYQEGLEPIIEKNPFYRPALFMPQTFSVADRARLTEGFHAMVADRILPGIKKFDDFYRHEYTPHCRKGYGLYGLPHAKEWYEFAIRANTNLPLDAATVHQIGLDEVKRITGELTKVKAQIGFKGSMKAFQESLKTDPKYYFKSSAEMFEAFAKVKEQVALKIPYYFDLTPKSDYKIVEGSNPEDPAGQYHDPTEYLPYGRFVVNTKNLRAVPKFEVTTLLLHETVPGHHFQLALQFDLKDQLSEYQRKLYFSSAFAEGWALYSERLGNEMGMYEDPIQRLGNLNDEMLRAVRLVVDSGIHAYGWSHKKVVAYMSEHLVSDIKDIEVESNRYSVWPGQALAYKIGQLKILELRHRAEQELGPKFDLKEFHRVVIGKGTLSLSVLETEVMNWIQAKKASI